MIVFVGYPASGKSTFAKKYLVPAGYEHINRDTLVTQSKCLQLTRSALKEGKSVVVDNTNPSEDSRASYVSIAKEMGIPVRCFIFDIPRSLAEHLNMYREKVTGGESRHVPKIGYAVYQKNFKMPRQEEGFIEVKKINFIPQFASPKDQELFNQLT